MSPRRRSPLRVLATVLATGVALGAAGCTNAPPPTRERTDYALAADRICTQLEDAVGPLRDRATRAVEGGRLDDAARLAREAADAGTALLDRLAGLEAPADDREEVRRWVADLRAQQEGLRRVGDAIEDRDPERATRVNEEINDLAKRTRRFAFDFGMQTCSK